MGDDFRRRFETALLCGPVCGRCRGTGYFFWDRYTRYPCQLCHPGCPPEPIWHPQKREWLERLKAIEKRRGKEAGDG